MKDIKITFSDDSRDFAGWASEKSGYVLSSMCNLLRDVPDLSENGNFNSALADSLKIYALCHGNLNGIYCHLVISLLMQYNIDGFYFLEDLVHNTKKSNVMHKIAMERQFNKALDLIEENNKYNRSELAEALAKMDASNFWVIAVTNDLEFVHNGERSWEWFYAKHGNDREAYTPSFTDHFLQEVYTYFHSCEYSSASDLSEITIN